jgi:ribosomal protein S6
MPATQPLYDLVLMLDTAADDGRRAEVLSSVQEAVRKGGEIVNEQDWGARAMAFEIRHKTDAEYHLLQFHATPDLLGRLERSLRITDEVVRFRIIKLAPGTPDAPEHRPEPRPAGAAPEVATEMAAEGGSPAADTSLEEAPVAPEAPAEDAPEPVDAPAEEAPTAAEAPAPVAAE